MTREEARKKAHELIAVIREKSAIECPLSGEDDIEKALYEAANGVRRQFNHEDAVWGKIDSSKLYRMLHWRFDEHGPLYDQNGMIHPQEAFRFGPSAWLHLPNYGRKTFGLLREKLIEMGIVREEGCALSRAWLNA